MPILTDENIDRRFIYIQPNESRRKSHEFIRHECLKLAHSINSTCPPVSETLRAIQALEEVMFLCNAAISRYGD